MAVGTTNTKLRRCKLGKELSDFEAFKHINELFGNNARMAYEKEEVDIISTTSPSLDRALGVGGWPRGRFIQLAGQPSAGKTLLSLLAIAEWQSLDPENCAAFIDAEFTYDPEWADSLGVDNNRVLLIRDNSGANIITGLVGKSKVNKQTKKVTKIPGLLDFITEGKVIKTKSATGDVVSYNCGKLGVIVLDSVASINTPVEEVSDAGKQNMALMARFLSVELKKLTPAIARANVAFMAINQVRTSPGVLFGDPTTSPGGNALKHACSVMVMVGMKNAKDTFIFNDLDERIGGRIVAKIGKNKVATPFKTAEYSLIFNKGVQNLPEELLDVGVMTGFIERPNSRSYIINGEKLTSRDAAIEYVNDNYEDLNLMVRDSYLSDKNNDAPEDDGEYEVVELDNPLLITE